MWSDQRNGTDNTDVFLISSSDGGTHWGTVRKVNSDGGNAHQFFPWMTIDQTTGHLYFIFYDRRNTTGAGTDVYIARSVDGGDTFQNLLVSDSSFTPQDQVFFGDYTNIAASEGLIYPIWMRMDGTVLSIWIARLAFLTPVEDDGASAIPRGFWLAQNYPNPFNPRTEIKYQVPEACNVQLRVYDLLGREAAMLVNAQQSAGKYSVTFDGSGLASGVYFYRLVTSGGIVQKSMILLR
jgi:hypothetical protein